MEGKMLIEKRLKAKEYRLNKQFDLAEDLYMQLWESRSHDWDKWLGWEYADTLKKIGKNDEAIQICKEVYHKWKDFKHNNDLLCWALYEKYIKRIQKDATLQEISKAIRIAEFIVSNAKQDGKKSAYESTVFKIIDIIKNKNNINDNEILKWIDRLDYNLLTDEVMNYTLSDGLCKEGASRKEQYFSIKTKSLLRMGKYQQCIECCNQALIQINKFHYSNDVWFDTRRNYCIAMTTENEEFELAVQNLVTLADRKKHWSIYGQVLECYMRQGNYKNAIMYGAKALLTKDPVEMKVGLLLDYGSALEKIGDIENAINHFHLSYKTRVKSSWHIPAILQDKIVVYNINESASIDMSTLKRFWLDNAQAGEEMVVGKVLRIMPHGKSGFITAENKESYFFKRSSIVSGYHHLAEGKSAKFRLIESFDVKKQIKSLEAVDIVINT
jgi:tetratricopeptide (TPR) repeat protein